MGISGQLFLVARFLCFSYLLAPSRTLPGAIVYRSPSFILVALIAPAYGDTIYLRNGDRISGEVQDIDSAQVHWKLGDGKEILFPLTDVDRVEYDEKFSPEDHPLGGVIGDQPDEGEPRPDETASEAPPVEPQMVIDQPEFWDYDLDWLEARLGKTTKRLEIGLTRMEGNTNQMAINLLYRLERNVGFSFFQGTVGGHYAKSDSLRTANRWYGDTTFDFAKEDLKWIFFIRGLHEYDQFQNLDYRGTISSGIGYRIYNDEKWRLIFRAGPGATIQVFHDPSSRDITPTMLLEMEFRRPLFDRTIFEQKTTFSQTFDDLENNRLTNDCSILVPLDEKKKWSFKAGLRYDYNGAPNRNREPSDLTTMLNLVYTN